MTFEERFSKDRIFDAGAAVVRSKADSFTVSFGGKVLAILSESEINPFCDNLFKQDAYRHGEFQITKG
jgi:hypothetical protein